MIIDASRSMSWRQLRLDAGLTVLLSCHAIEESHRHAVGRLHRYQFNASCMHFRLASPTVQRIQLSGSSKCAQEIGSRIELRIERMAFFG